MYGRYGIDSLYYVLLVTYVVLIVLNSLITNDIANIVIGILAWLAIIILIFRLMSRNHIKRRKELELYRKVTRPVVTFFTLNFKRIKDIRSKRYRVCPNCKAVMRLPIKKGTHGVVCPKCNNKFTVKIRF